MMNTKLFSLLASVAAIAISAAPMAANAQPGFSNLNLTTEQQAQLEQIREATDSQIETILTPEQRQQFQSLREQRQQVRQGMKNLNLTEEQRTQMREIRRSAREQVQEVLTEEQRQQLRERMGSRRGRR